MYTTFDFEGANYRVAYEMAQENGRMGQFPVRLRKETEKVIDDYFNGRVDANVIRDYIFRGYIVENVTTFTRRW